MIVVLPAQVKQSAHVLRAGRTQNMSKNNGVRET
jgi:hypothetical protein